MASTAPRSLPEERDRELVGLDIAVWASAHEEAAEVAGEGGQRSDWGAGPLARHR